jgi:ribulose-5-phosphate 4-epimerase/fuculose-1-phosphate aldolase
MRLADTYLITPTDAPLGDLDPGKLAHVGADGIQLSGGRPSKTLALHRAIYASDPAARVVIHTHAIHLVALTLIGVWSVEDILPPLTPYQVMKVGHVPLVEYRRPGHPEVIGLVQEAIGRRALGGVGLRAVMLDRLGPVVWGADVVGAMATLEELEETARLWLLTGGRVAALPEPAISDLQDTFAAPW